MAENKRINIRLMNISQEKYRTNVQLKGDNITENKEGYIMTEYITILNLYAYSI